MSPTTESETVEERLVRIETKLDIMIKQAEDKQKAETTLVERILEIERQVLIHKIYFRVISVSLGGVWLIVLPLIVDKLKAILAVM